VIDVLDGRSRRTVQRWLQALPEADRRSIEVVSIDPYDAHRQAIRAECRTPGSASITSTWSAAPTPRWTPSAASDNEPSGGGGRRAPAAAPTRRAGDPRSTNARHRLLKARERLNERERRRLAELFAHEPLIAEAWGLKQAFRAVDRAADRTTAEQRLGAFLLAVGRAGIPAFDAFQRASRAGAKSCWPTSTNRPATATAKASSTRSR
jgi:Transposase